MEATLNRTEPRPTFVDSTPLLADPEALRARGDEDGYLFFKGLLPAEDVRRVRADLLGVVARHGWLRAGGDPMEGLLDVEALSGVPEEQMRTDIGVSHAAYDDAQRLESVHRLPHHPHLLALYETLFGGPVLAHPRHIIRMVTPHPALVPTPQHQDFPLIQGTPRTWTCWFPVGDCPRDRGALTVLSGSHRGGYLPIQASPGAGSIAAQTCPWEDDWVEGDFEIGDVLTFPSFTVHRALPSRQRDRIRLSLDVRYQPVGEPVEAKSLQPHCGLSWDEIYAGWERADLCRYWHRSPLTMAPWNPTYLQPQRRIC